MDAISEAMRHARRADDAGFGLAIKALMAGMRSDAVTADQSTIGKLRVLHAISETCFAEAPLASRGTAPVSAARLPG